MQCHATYSNTYVSRSNPQASLGLIQTLLLIQTDRLFVGLINKIYTDNIETDG